MCPIEIEFYLETMVQSPNNPTRLPELKLELKIEVLVNIVQNKLVVNLSQNICSWTMVMYIMTG